MRRLVRPFTLVALSIAASGAICPRSSFAAAMPAASFDQVARAWMGTVVLLAADGEERDRGERSPGARGGREAPRIVMEKMDDILARLSRIEAKLDGRPAGPMRGEWRGPRPEGPRPPHGGRGPDGRPEMPAEVREQMRKRMEEGRERMEQARQKFREMEERIRRLEAEIERLKADR